MKFFTAITGASLVAAMLIAGPGVARAEPVNYEWESTSGFMFSESREAIEEITGQVARAVQTQLGERFVVMGAMRGTFTYDASAATFLQSRGTAIAYTGSSQAWTSHLESAGVTIGTFTGDIGETIVRDGDPTAEPDLLNVNMCAAPWCVNPTVFTIGNWRATYSSIVWIDGGFLDSFMPPAVLPPPDAPVPLGMFLFFNEQTGANESILTRGLVIREAVQQVEIDVKPGSDDNCLNINGHGTIPIAIFGSEELDVMNIDQSSLAFGGISVRIRGNRYPQCGAEYVNGDEFVDLVCHFQDDSSAWLAGDGEATLEGALLDGKAIKGSDTICLVP